MAGLRGVVELVSSFTQICERFDERISMPKV